MRKVKCIKIDGLGSSLTIGKEYETHPDPDNNYMFFIINDKGNRHTFYNFDYAGKSTLPGCEDFRTQDYLEEVPESKSYYHTAVCKGSWMLGTACGRCQRCIDTKPETPKTGDFFECTKLPSRAVVGQCHGLPEQNPEFIIGEDYPAVTSAAGFTVHNKRGEYVELTIHDFHECFKAPVKLIKLKRRGSLTIAAMCAIHSAWLDRMGWNKTNPLEQLALVASEFGEAIDELPDYHPDKARFAELLPVLGRAVNCARSEELPKNFGTELADIVLRVSGIAFQNGINLEQCISDKMALNEINGNLKGRKK